MSTVAEIERAISHLPPEQRTEIRRWAEFDVWLAASTGVAKGKLTTDGRMRETRGEDLRLACLEQPCEAYS